MRTCELKTFFYFKANVATLEDGSEIKLGKWVQRQRQVRQVR
jgi:hypothetical protein